MKRWIPLVLTLVFGLWALKHLSGPKNPDSGLPAKEFGSLPVVMNGRHQPMDSLARHSLLVLRKKQTANYEPWKGAFEKPRVVSAAEWMMEVMMNPGAADTRPVFRIDHSDVKGLLGVPNDPGEAGRTDGKHYAWNQIQPKLADLQVEASRASTVKQELRNAYDRGLLDLWESVNVYRSLRGALGPVTGATFAESLAAYRQKLEASRAAFQAQSEGRAFDREALAWAQEQLAAPLIVPAHGGDTEWTRALQEVAQLREGETPHFSLEAYAKMAAAYRAGDMNGLRAAIEEYRGKLETSGQYVKDLKKAKSEQLLNFVEPFYRGMVISVVAFMLAVLVWFSPDRFEWARKSAFRLMVLVLVLLTLGLIWRMVLEGRPPVTNLYSSALFIGWAAVVLGLALEAVWPRSIGVAVAALLGFATLMVAHYLSLDGDTMIMLRAVLDTNFWLATHVVIVTLGYAATFVAGFLGITYIIRGLFTPFVTREMGRAFGGMVFAIICFAALFSFVGTVLGGIWADQSWGRFWGWDPKENGALIIVLWNALILHARLGGMVKERGLMVLAVGGNIITSWSWFGVNMLGIGLHSYGFMDAAFWSLIGFVTANLILIFLGLLPLRWWVSFRDNAAKSGGKPSGPEPEAAASAQPAAG